MNEQTTKFILEFENADILQLALHSKKYPNVDVQLAIRQILGRQKIKSKVPRFYNTSKLLYPLQLSLEQSSSEVTAIYKSELCEGKTLADLTGGFGVDCCFLSSHFERVSYVERQLELCELANHNFKELCLENIEVYNFETEKFLQEMNPVDWIYIDPARRSNIGKKVVLLSDCEPNISLLSSTLLQKSSNLMVKLSPMMDISAAIKELPQTNEVHIIAVDNECKEVVLIIRQGLNKSLSINTVNFQKNKIIQKFSFVVDDEYSAEVQYTSKPGKYIYEPNAAIMKSGAYKTISKIFEICKLHINTHLYTSDKLILEFPGRIFEVVKIWDNSKISMKTLSKQIPKANISTRNYPLSVEELRKKTKVKDGGEIYIFACTISNEDKVLIECNKVNV